MGNRPFRSASKRLASRSALCINLTTMAVLSVFSIGLPMDVQAQETAVQINLPAQSLDDSLIQLGRQTDLQFFYTPQVVAGIRAPKVQGAMTPERALQRLLDGTPVQYRRDGKNVTLSRLMGETAQLASVTVVGSAGGLPPAYAGGQVATGGRVGLLGNMDVMDTPFNITSYTAETIENQQARSVADVLENNPIVQVQNAPARNAESFMMRGFFVPTTSVAFNGLYGLLPVYRVLPEFAERVEVLTGPSALLGGMTPTGAVGGSINLVPKRAEDVPLTRLSMGIAADSQWRTHADIGRRFGERGEWGIRVNASAQNGDTPMDGQSQSSHVGALALDYRSDKLRASLDVIDQNEKMKGGMQFQFGMTGDTVLEAPRNTSISVPGAGYEGHDKAAVLRTEYDITPKTTIYGAWGVRSDDHRATLGYPTVQANGNYTARLIQQRYSYDTRSGDAGLRTRFKTGSVGHQLSISANLYNEDYGLASSAATATATNLYNPAFLKLPGAAGSPQKTRTTQLNSVAIADTLSLMDERLLLTLGVRRQQIKVETFGAGAVTYDESATTPMVGSVYRLRDNVSVYANYIEGLSQGPTAPENTGLVNAGEVFPPYKSKQYEAGIKVDWGTLMTTLSIYQIKQPNSITENNRFSLDGEQRNRGIELNAYGEINRGLRLMAGASLIDAKITKAVGDTQGKKAIGVPAAQMKLGAEWDAPFAPGLTLSAQATWNSSQYANAANTQRVPSWTRVDVGARYATRMAGKNVTIRASVNNLFDRDYWSAVTKSGSAGYLLLGAPRTWMLSATVDF